MKKQIEFLKLRAKYVSRLIDRMQLRFDYGYIEGKYSVADEFCIVDDIRKLEDDICGLYDNNEVASEELRNARIEAENRFQIHINSRMKYAKYF